MFIMGIRKNTGRTAVLTELLRIMIDMVIGQGTNLISDLVKPGHCNVQYDTSMKLAKYQSKPEKL